MFSDLHRIVLITGKGGVGTTPIACAVAVALGARGREMLLITIDPAAHLTEMLAGKMPCLSVGQIDPKAEPRTYRDHILAAKCASFDAQSRITLVEDLRRPCTGEVAVFQAFSKAIRETRRKFAVLDTAPTGHAQLSLDATGSYHRDVLRHTGDDAACMTAPMTRLQDPDLVKILIVTLAETAPDLRAARLQEDLRRAGTTPWAGVIGTNLAATAAPQSVLAARAVTEVPEIASIKGTPAGRLSIALALAQGQVGAHRLRARAGTPIAAAAE